jgi:hypothetical protein
MFYIKVYYRSNAKAGSRSSDWGSLAERSKSQVNPSVFVFRNLFTWSEKHVKKSLHFGGTYNTSRDLSASVHKLYYEEEEEEE